jgi:hypothetical protein
MSGAHPARAPRRSLVVRVARQRCGARLGVPAARRGSFGLGAALDGAGRGRRTPRRAVGWCALALAARALLRWLSGRLRLTGRAGRGLCGAHGVFAGRCFTWLLSCRIPGQLLTPTSAAMATLPLMCSVCRKCPMTLPLCLSTTTAYYAACVACAVAPDAAAAAPFHELGAAPTTSSLLAALRNAAPVGAANVMYVLRSWLSTLELADAQRAEPGASRAVLAALDAHASELLMQSAALGALTELVTLSVPRQDEAVAAGALDAAVRALRAHVDDADIVLYAAKTLRFLLLNNAKQQAPASAAGALDAVLDAMSRHVVAPAVQYQLMGAVLFLTMHNQSATAAAVANGLPARLAEVMAAHAASTDAAAVEASWQALNLITVSLGTSIKTSDVTCAKQFKSAGALGWIGDSLRANSANKDIAAEALRATLLLIAGSTTDRAFAVDVSAADWAVDALRKHSACPDISFAALALLCLVGSTARDTLVGSFPALLGALKAQARSYQHAFMGAVVLNVLIKENNELSAAAAVSGAVPVVLTLLRTHPGRGDVQAQGALALALLSVDESAHSAARQNGALPLLAAAARAHEADATTSQLLGIAQKALERRPGPMEAALREALGQAVEAAVETAKETATEFITSGAQEFAMAALEIALQTAVEGGCCAVQ